ncbi:helix-turn-helix domain-containing protein [Paraburkholderia sp. LEh10]|nr:helix-turn-helix domain-containing protein [Paraburkholderia sp. LEh10]
MFFADDRQWRSIKHPTLRRIAFVLTDACDLLGVGVIAEALECAGALATAEGSQGYELRFLSADGGFVKCDRSLIVSTDKLAKACEMRFAAIFVAGAPDSRAVGNALSQVSWLNRMKANGTPVRFLTASAVRPGGDAAARTPAGIDTFNTPLHGRDQKARLGNAIKIAFDVICGDFGESIAREALRRTAFVDSNELASVHAADVAVTAVDRIRAVAQWLQDNCHRAVSVADAADACAMSQRTLLRYFHTYVGTSPSEYLQRVRLERACELLAETSLPADKIARRVGLTNGDRLGKLFRRCIGKSPMGYRAWRRAKLAGGEASGRPGFTSHSQIGIEVCNELS